MYCKTIPNVISDKQNGLYIYGIYTVGFSGTNSIFLVLVVVISAITKAVSCYMWTMQVHKAPAPIGGLRTNRGPPRVASPASISEE